MVQQNLYRAILDANSAFEGQVKGLNLVWMDTDYPKLSNAQYKTDKKTGEVTVVVADGKTLNTPLAEYDGFKTPSLKPNVEDSIIPLDITDDIENLHIPELHAMDFITRQVVDYIKSLGIPVHTREELIQYLKDHGYENIQQAFEEQRKKSNLNERQWLQVRTKPFINWFGDWMNDPANASKVVDENGEPLVVYHGTNADFTEFKFTTPREAFYFGNKEGAKGYTTTDKTMPLFVNIKNPLLAENYNIVSQFPKVAKDNGHDGIIWKPSKVVDKSAEFVAFESNQIKSATDNIGTFSTENDDIQMAIDTDYVTDSVSDEEKEEIYIQLKKINRAKRTLIDTGQGLYLIDHTDVRRFIQRP